MLRAHVHSAKAKKVLGQPVLYRAGEPPERERLRVKEELMDAVTRLGRSLPPAYGGSLRGDPPEGLSFQPGQ